MFLLSIIVGLCIKRFSAAVAYWWGAYSIIVPLIFCSLIAVGEGFNSSLQEELILSILSTFLVGMGVMYCVYKLKEYFRSEKSPETKEHPLQDPSSGIHSFFGAPKSESEPIILEAQENEPLTHEPVINAESPKPINSLPPPEEANSILADTNNTTKDSPPIQTMRAKENTYLNIDDALLEKAQAVAADMGLDLSSAVKMFLIQMIRENALPFTPNANQHKEK